MVPAAVFFTDTETPPNGSLADPVTLPVTLMELAWLKANVEKNKQPSKKKLAVNFIA